MNKSLKHRAKIKKRSKQVKIAIDAIYDTVDILALVAAKRSAWLSAISIGVKLYGALSKHAEDAGIKANDDDVFQNEGWKHSKFEEWDYFIEKTADELLPSDKKYTFPSKSESLIYKIYEYKGVEFGFYYSMEDHLPISGPWWPEEACSEEEFGNILSELIWSKFKNGFCEISKKGISSYSSSYVASEVKSCETELASQTAKDILENVKKYNDAGIMRSIMLNGEPGSGKTSIMNYVAAQLGGNVIRFSLDQIKNGIRTTSGLELLKPSTVLIDDFDRLTSGHDYMLESIEKLSNSVKLIMVSTNSLKDMPKAIMRPGRFDELMQIDGLDEDRTLAIIGDLSQDLVDRLKVLPVAYIQEFKKREKVLGLETAEKTLVNLEMRFKDANAYAENCKKMYDEDEEYDEDVISSDPVMLLD